MPNTEQSLSAMQRQLLDHVARYRMTTAAAVACDDALPIKTVATAKRRLSECVDSGLMGQARLYRNRSYYYLMPRAVDLLKDSTDQAERLPAHGPLSEPAKIRAYAMLAFCCLANEQRIRITNLQFEHDMRDLYRPGVPMNHYVAHRSRSPVIGFLRIDAGGKGRWDRIVHKIRHDIESHWQHRRFQELIQTDRFEIAVVTATSAKCKRLQQALSEDRKLRPVPLRIVAIPELIHLIAPPATVATPMKQDQH